MCAYVYILTNKKRKTLYTGVTGNNDLRLERHRAELGSKFAKKYNLRVLVHLQRFECPRLAITREKELKGWNRLKKLALINRKNAEWVNIE